MQIDTSPEAYKKRWTVYLFGVGERDKRFEYIEQSAALRKAKRHIDDAQHVGLTYARTALVVDENDTLFESFVHVNEKGETMNILRETGVVKRVNGKLLRILTKAGKMTATISDVRMQSGPDNAPEVAVFFREFPQYAVLNTTRTLQLMEDLGYETDRWVGARVELSAESEERVAFKRKYFPYHFRVVSTPPAQTEKMFEAYVGRMRKAHGMPREWATEALQAAHGADVAQTFDPTNESYYTDDLIARWAAYNRDEPDEETDEETAAKVAALMGDE
jgi:hypothetical protein